MRIDLTGQRAFVTAGAAGMGRATALTLAELGATVLTCDIDAAALETLPEKIGRAVCDVADSAAIDELLGPFAAEGLDILVNNAGIAGPTKLIEDVTDDEWRQTMAIDVDAMFYCVRRAVPVFKRQGAGVIINMTSTAGTFGYPTRSPYVAAKWAVTGLTQSLAMELGPHNVRVNAIAPGAVSGDRMDRVVAGHAEVEGIDEDEVRRLYTIGVSMQCWIDPQEIADTIAFLCSDYGRHISGQVLAVDGNTETLWPRS